MRCEAVELYRGGETHDVETNTDVVWKASGEVEQHVTEKRHVVLDDNIQAADKEKAAEKSAENAEKQAAHQERAKEKAKHPIAAKASVALERDNFKAEHSGTEAAVAAGKAAVEADAAASAAFTPAATPSPTPAPAKNAAKVVAVETKAAEAKAAEANATADKAEKVNKDDIVQLSKEKNESNEKNEIHHKDAIVQLSNEKNESNGKKEIHHKDDIATEQGNKESVEKAKSLEESNEKKEIHHKDDVATELGNKESVKKAESAEKVTVENEEAAAAAEKAAVAAENSAAETADKEAVVIESDEKNEIDRKDDVATEQGDKESVEKANAEKVEKNTSESKEDFEKVNMIAESTKKESEFKEDAEKELSEKGTAEKSGKETDEKQAVAEVEAKTTAAMEEAAHQAPRERAEKATICPKQNGAGITCGTGFVLAQLQIIGDPVWGCAWACYCETCYGCEVDMDGVGVMDGIGVTAGFVSTFEEGQKDVVTQNYSAVFQDGVTLVAQKDYLNKCPIVLATSKTGVGKNNITSLGESSREGLSGNTEPLAEEKVTKGGLARRLLQFTSDKTNDDKAAAEATELEEKAKEAAVTAADKVKKLSEEAAGKAEEADRNASAMSVEEAENETKEMGQKIQHIGYVVKDGALREAMKEAQLDNVATGANQCVTHFGQNLVRSVTVGVQKVKNMYRTIAGDAAADFQSLSECFAGSDLNCFTFNHGGLKKTMFASMACAKQDMYGDVNSQTSKGAVAVSSMSYHHESYLSPDSLIADALVQFVKHEIENMQLIDYPHLLVTGVDVSQNRVQPYYHPENYMNGVSIDIAFVSTVDGNAEHSESVALSAVVSMSQRKSTVDATAYNFPASRCRPLIEDGILMEDKDTNKDKIGKSRRVLLKIDRGGKVDQASVDEPSRIEEVQEVSVESQQTDIERAEKAAKTGEVAAKILTGAQEVDEKASAEKTEKRKKETATKVMERDYKTAEKVKQEKNEAASKAVEGDQIQEREGKWILQQEWLLSPVVSGASIVLVSQTQPRGATDLGNLCKTSPKGPSAFLDSVIAHINGRLDREIGRLRFMAVGKRRG